MADKPAPLAPSDVEALVGSAHGDLPAVQRLIDATPALLNAAWDWGGGDWETALGAASHMGRRDIAHFLVARGARIDIFAAAMLGETEIVRAMLDTFPDLIHAKGPHGIPLAANAERGGDDASDVAALLNERRSGAVHP
jgi:hypothetical protein